ncbi:MAG: hypothetical protein Ct9H300mP10_06880 [Methanobacteriota archaeon]|nr:MAG: hypothetical protein Ct9H300mP10_06880 [Euryarchaeota archaeon]
MHGPELQRPADRSHRHRHQRRAGGLRGRVRIALDLTSTDPKTHYIQLELNNSGFDSVEDYDSFQVKIRSPAIEETTDWIGWLLGALLVVALLLLTRGGGRRRSSAPF